MPDTTPDRIRPGMRFRENGCYAHFGVYTVVSIRDGTALLEHQSTTCVSGIRVRLEAMHTDGVKRRSGWSLVPNINGDAE